MSSPVLSWRRGTRFEFSSERNRALAIIAIDFQLETAPRVSLQIENRRSSLKFWIHISQSNIRRSYLGNERRSRKFYIHCSTSYCYLSIKYTLQKDSTIYHLAIETSSNLLYFCKLRSISKGVSTSIWSFVWSVIVPVL